MRWAPPRATKPRPKAAGAFCLCGIVGSSKWRQYLLGVWRRHQDKPEVAALYQSKLMIARSLLREWVKEHPHLKLPVTFDNWYTQPAFCRFLDRELGLPYVGTVASDDQVILRSGRLTLEEFAARLWEEHPGRGRGRQAGLPQERNHLHRQLYQKWPCRSTLLGTTSLVVPSDTSGNIASEM